MGPGGSRRGVAAPDDPGRGAELETTAAEDAAFWIPLGLTAVPLAGLASAAARQRRTGLWPVRRAAPWAMFWILPLLTAAAALTSFGSLLAMLLSIEITGSGPC